MERWNHGIKDSEIGRVLEIGISLSLMGVKMGLKMGLKDTIGVPLEVNREDWRKDICRQQVGSSREEEETRNQNGRLGQIS